MQIIRFRTADNHLYMGCDYDGTTASVVEGDVYGKLTDTGKRENVAKFEVPVVPKAIFLYRSQLPGPCKGNRHGSAEIPGGVHEKPRGRDPP